MHRQSVADHNTPLTDSHHTNDLQLLRTESHLMMPLTPTTMASPSPMTDAPLVSENSNKSAQQGHSIVVEPSFDQSETGSSKHDLKDLRDGAPEDHRQHSRNLSAHFYDATRLSDDHHTKTYPTQQSSRPPQEDQLSPHVKTDSVDKSSDNAKVGQKHGRGLSSGDASNPAFAHRRMNSTGNSMQVDRSYPGYNPPPASHHRKTSSGLDMLSAAAGVSSDELAMAAGRPADAAWEPPSNEGPPRRSPEGQYRMSPPANAVHHGHSNSFDYHGRTAPPPPPYHHAHPGYHHPGPPPPPSNYHGHAYPPAHPPPPPHGHWGPPPPHMAYPVQYAPPRGNDAYGKGGHYSHPGAPPPHQPRLGPQDAPQYPRPSRDGRIETDEHLFQQQHPPAPPRHRPTESGQWENAGVQTFVTAIGVGDGTKTLQPSATTRTTSTNTANEQQPVPSTVSHHRKMSSFGSLSTMMASGIFSDHQQPVRPNSSNGQFLPAGQRGHHRKTSSNLSFLMDNERQPPAGAHHRSTSSSVSFLQCLDDGPLSNEAFLQSIAGQAPPYNPHQQGPPAGFRGISPKQQEVTFSIKEQPLKPEATSSGPAGQVLASGGTSKRVRRKCSIESCTNRVVQGGLCIAHGAKRKQCKHPGCTKNVKKAGLCSTHGPARKRCDFENCKKVAVQGGRCIAHGAKKKVCSVADCHKQAIILGMCKKHHDKNYGHGVTAEEEARLNRADSQSSSTGDREPAPALEGPVVRPEAVQKPTHQRGLSIFQEMSADTVSTLLSTEESAGPL